VQDLDHDLLFLIRWFPDGALSLECYGGKDPEVILSGHKKLCPVLD
jgi:hypothetical protein